MSEKQLVKLNVSEKMLTGFKDKYAKENLPTGDTKAGYTFLKDGIAELRGYRTGTETFRKSAVSPLNIKVKEINSVCKNMIDELSIIEQPMKDLKQVEDDRLAKIKACSPLMRLH